MIDASLDEIAAARPEATEAASYYFTYINLVPPGDIRDILEDQSTSTLAFLQDISAEQAAHRYSPDKWSIADALNHVNDTERLFVFRAFWFARGFDIPLPSFDQDIAAVVARADERPWSSHVEEFAAVRAATVSLFRSLPADAWLRTGKASGNTFTVRALANITAGHVLHHERVIRDRYLVRA